VGDVLIITGDILWIDICNILDTGIKQLENFNVWLGKQPFKYKIVVAGNHDRTIEILGSDKTSDILSNAYYLENKSIFLEGISIYGNPMSCTGKSANRAFQVSVKNFHEAMLAFPKADIILTHACYSNMQDYFDKLLKPRLHVFGHFHKQYGVSFGDNTTFINAAISNSIYLPAHLPIMLDFPIM